MAKRDWMVLVHGYGSFPFTGTRLGAEQALADKARWEGSHGRVWPVDPETEVERLEKEVGEEFASKRSCPMSLLNRLSAARKRAVAAAA